MSDQVELDDTELEEATDEMTVLKERARAMGLKVSPNIGLEALRAKVAKALSDETPDPVETVETVATPMSSGATRAARLQQARRENLKLIRIRVACLNPDKMEWPGEVFTVAGKYIGIVKKYVPFGEATDDGYHVPKVIYEMMKARKFLQKKTRKDPRNPANVIIDTRWVPEFAIEVLEQLDQTGLRRLALQQAAAAGTAE